MANTNLKPGTAITKTQSKLLAGNSKNLDAVRKNNVRRLPKKAEHKALRRMTISYVTVRHYDRKTNRTKRYTRYASLRQNGGSQVCHWHKIRCSRDARLPGDHSSPNGNATNAGTQQNQRVTRR